MRYLKPCIRKPDLEFNSNFISFNQFLPLGVPHCMDLWKFDRHAFLFLSADKTFFFVCSVKDYCHTCTFFLLIEFMFSQISLDPVFIHTSTCSASKLLKFLTDRKAVTYERLQRANRQQRTVYTSCLSRFVY